MDSQLIKGDFKLKKTGRSRHLEVFQKATMILAQCKIASAYGLKEELLEEAIYYMKSAERFHLNEVAMNLSRFLQSYYINRVHDKKKALIFEKHRERNTYLFNIEQIVDTKFLSLTLRLNEQKHTKELLETVRQVCIEFEPYKKLRNVPILTKIYMLQISYAYAKADYDEVIKLASEIIDFLHKGNFTYFASFYYSMVPVLIIRKQFDEARRTIKKAISRVNKKGHNWDLFKYMEFLIEMHSKNYNHAFNIYKRVERKKVMNAMLEERWLIAKGYMNFLIRNGYIESTDRVFRVGKFLNSVPIASKDKKGLNVDVLIVYILDRLSTKKDLLIDQHETLRKYAQTHLTGRTELFFRLLLSLIIPSKNSKQRLEKLKSSKTITNEVLAFEIIPYEHLWEILLCSNPIHSH